MNELLWKPTPKQIERANMTRFQSYVRQAYDIPVKDYADLYRWSIREPAHFWAAVWRFCEVRAMRGWDTVLEEGERMPGARWFSGSRLNFAANLLRFRDDHTALVFVGEDGHRVTRSYRELCNEVARLTRGLRTAGVGTGDRVAGFLPNIPETVAAMLATASIGAIWSSCSPDFGVEAVVDRFGQIAPKVLFTTDGYRYNGKVYDTLGRMRDVRARLPGLDRVVVVPFLAGRLETAALPDAVSYAEFLGSDDQPELRLEALPFQHPLCILYSSGTTGKPKCIVHGAGGTLIQHLKELVLHTDLRRDDRIFYFTSCGWMMWNWLVSSLASGATVLLYDGSPFHPGPQRLLDIAEQEGMTVFGTSAKYLAALEKVGVRPRTSHRLAALRTILSTGSPLLPALYDYVYRDVSPDVQLSSISGGTDIISCFALGNPVLPVYRGELQSRGLGMKVEVFDENGHPVINRKGELVCTRPFPSMPVGFWNDPGQEKYRRAYFDRFPGVWAHGDYAEITAHDGMIIYGRSDAVLNPGGVRIGTAEIYRQVEQLPEVLESLAVGQEWEGDERVILFVCLRKGKVLDDILVNRIKTVIRENTTSRHVPARVFQVADIPRTRNNKIAELAVRNVIHGRPVQNIEALSNPEALELFRDLPGLDAA
ncbi:MAG: acetoacetate--CoA ligase [Pseudomonadota bacterium]|nr:acetoacetate--CoA ligase [Pseudomonadota bacterium]